MKTPLTLLLEGVEGLSPEQVKLTIEFHRLLDLGNQKQNLTRLISPADFFRGHFLDVWEGVQHGGFQGRCLDFGSGCGVPGLLLAALLPETHWELVESERRKAEFLQETAEALGLSSRVRVIAERFEKVAKSLRPDVLTCRAVGKLVEMENWVLPCSTWNSWILYKGPRWDEEWSEYQARSQPTQRLRLVNTHEYSVETGGPIRRLVTLARR